jgi:hypothetical protein
LLAEARRDAGVALAGARDEISVLLDELGSAVEVVLHRLATVRDDRAS